LKKLVIKTIDAKSIYPVRHSVLRQGKPLSSCIFNGDNLETTIHIGGFIGDNLIAISTMLENNNTSHELSNAIQLRGMAVLKEHQKKGYGQQLLKFAEKLSKENNKTFLWMNARVKAVDFYQKLNYNKVGNVFEVLDVGKHYVMFKKLP